MTDLDQLLRDVEGRLQDEQGPVGRGRALPSPVRLALALGLAVVIVATVAVLMPRPDLADYPGERLLADLGLLALPWCALVLLRLRPLHRPLPAAWQAPVTGLAVAAAATALVLLPQAHTGHPAALEGTGPDMVGRAVACLLFGLGWGIPFALFTLALQRRPDRGPLAGMVGAAVGMAVLVVHCPIIHVDHLVSGHLGVMVVLAILPLALALGAGGLSARRSGRPT